MGIISSKITILSTFFPTQFSSPGVFFAVLKGGGFCKKVWHHFTERKLTVGFRVRSPFRSIFSHWFRVFLSSINITGPYCIPIGFFNGFRFWGEVHFWIEVWCRGSATYYHIWMGTCGGSQVDFWMKFVLNFL